MRLKAVRKISQRFLEKWLDENASEYLTEDEMKDLKEKINAMTADVDFFECSGRDIEELLMNLLFFV